MSDSEHGSLAKPFDRLDESEIERLRSFTSSEGLLVLGLDRRSWPPLRGGCFVYVVASAMVFLFVMGPQLGMSETFARSIATAGAVWVTWTFLRSYRAVRRSRVLADHEEGWFALAWSESLLCYRSWDFCLLLRWSELAKVEYLGEEVGGGLADSLWLTTVDRERVLLETHEGLFAGRQPSEWARDLESQWRQSTGREPEGQGRDG